MRSGWVDERKRWVRFYIPTHVAMRLRHGWGTRALLLAWNEGFLFMKLSWLLPVGCGGVCFWLRGRGWLGGFQVGAEAFVFGFEVGDALAHGCGEPDDLLFGVAGGDVLGAVPVEG